MDGRPSTREVPPTDRRRTLTGPIHKTAVLGNQRHLTEYFGSSICVAASRSTKSQSIETIESSGSSGENDDKLAMTGGEFDSGHCQDRFVSTARQRTKEFPVCLIGKCAISPS
jgi:hypothetical protein